MLKVPDRSLFTATLLIIGASVFGPAVVALLLDNHLAARVFFYHGALATIIFSFVAIATSGRRLFTSTQLQLAGILATFLFAPAYFAAPVLALADQLDLFDAYFDMLTAFTTTGGWHLPIPEPHAVIVHYWRCQVGWMGGLLVWIGTMVVLRPLALGNLGASFAEFPRRGIKPEHRFERSVQRHAEGLVILYAALTLLATALLLACGLSPLDALGRAMSAISTNGVTAPADGPIVEPGIWAELTLFSTMALSLSCLLVIHPPGRASLIALGKDTEFRLAAGILLAVTALFTLLNLDFIFVDAGAQGLASGLQILWSLAFTIMSFLTTTGIESAAYPVAELAGAIAGMPETLALLCLTGGGIATTAGGIKLLRVFDTVARCRHEISRSVSPLAANPTSRYVTRNADLTWSAVMLFAFSVAFCTLALALCDIPFESAIIMSIAALSTTGPLISAFPDASASLTDAARLLLALAMIVGRLETILLTSVLWTTAIRR